MTRRLVAVACRLVDRICAFQYRSIQSFSMPRIRRQHLVCGLFAGLTSLAAACSGGDNPTAPSKTTNTLVPVEFSSTVGSNGTAQLDTGTRSSDITRTDTGQTNDGQGKRRQGNPKNRNGDMRRRIEYCKKLSPGHERYDRCQQWLGKIESRLPGRGDTSKGRGRGDKKKRIEYCKSLEPSHQDYQRCQNRLGSKGKAPGQRRK